MVTRQGDWFEFKHLFYDETCLVMFRMDSDELKEKNNGQNKG